MEKHNLIYFMGGFYNAQFRMLQSYTHSRVLRQNSHFIEKK